MSNWRAWPENASTLMSNNNLCICDSAAYTHQLFTDCQGSGIHWNVLLLTQVRKRPVAAALSEVEVLSEGCVVHVHCVTLDWILLHSQCNRSRTTDQPLRGYRVQSYCILVTGISDWEQKTRQIERKKPRKNIKRERERKEEIKGGEWKKGRETWKIKRKKKKK